MSSESLELLLGAKRVGSSTLNDIEAAGFESVKEVGACTPAELSDRVDGVGYSTAVNILKHLEEEGYRTIDTDQRNREQLVSLLEELFEFGRDDLDFGVYKLMNQKRERVEQFINEELVQVIEESVQELEEEVTDVDVEQKRQKVVESVGEDAFLKDGSIDETYQGTPVVNEYLEAKEQAESQPSLENTRAEIYNYVYQFFNRYYENGDFITQRHRTQNEPPYSVPYDGSNTNFHWVTKNQYYAKSSEQLTRFSFTHDEYKYRFITKNGEYDGTGIGNSEYFVMEDADSIHIDHKKKQVTVRFYRRMIGEEDTERYNISGGSHNKQSGMNKAFVDTISDVLTDADVEFASDTIHSKLSEYTARNQSDFFIHKHLESFLENELEEYVKTEVVSYEIQEGFDGLSNVDVEKGRVVNEIASKVISFLAQIEEFKRKLFEKQKFVTDSHNLVPVADIKKEHYETILSNKAQLEQWNDSFGVAGLTSQDLDNSPYDRMMVDTRLFDEDITAEDEMANKLIKGDNHQALNFLQEKYKGSVDCIYIDPPYNTGSANFAYKDNYQQPTWLSMMYDRLQKSYQILKKGGVIFISVDDNEIENILKLGNKIFGEENHVANIVWEKTHTRKNSAKYFSESHDFIVSFAKDKSKWERNLLPREDTSAYTNPNDDKRGPWKLDPCYANNPNMEYTIEKPNGVELNSPDGKYWRYSKETFKQLADEDKVVWGEGDSYPKIKRFLSETQDGLVPETLFTREFAGDNATASRELTNLLGVSKSFDYPKPTKLIKQILRIAAPKDEAAIVVDFFAGSGTTAQAVKELNQERDTPINYVLVEMLDDAFDLIEERVQRVEYSNDWKDGEPQIEKETSMDGEYVPMGVQCLELESYEQALDAVDFTDEQSTLTSHTDYLLNYMLELGTKGSPTIVDTEQFSTPTEYKLQLDTQENVTVDLMTTFNYLIGLENWSIQSEEIAGVDYTMYMGKTPGDQDTLIVWRHNSNDVCHNSEQRNIDTNNYDQVYVNGDSTLPNATPIETVFENRMFR